MSLSLNKAILAGRMTADPELKKTPSGVSVTTFSIAVDRKYSKEEKQTDFLDIVAWRSTAEFITRWFRKGSAICVVGSIQKRSWTDQNGQKRYATEIIADEAYFVESKGEGAAAPAGAAPTYEHGAGFEDLSSDDELPF